jgi:hypothetical protein
MKPRKPKLDWIGKVLAEPDDRPEGSAATPIRIVWGAKTAGGRPSTHGRGGQSGHDDPAD